MLKKRFFSVLAIATSLVFFTGLFAENFKEKSSREEAFFLRRLAEFWEEGDVQIVKMQIQKYLQNAEDSQPFSQYLYGILADILMEENNPKEAFFAYGHIVDENIREKMLTNYLQCLFDLKKYDLFVTEAEKSLSNKELKNYDSILYLYCHSQYENILSSKIVEEKKNILACAYNYFDEAMQGKYCLDVKKMLAHIYEVLEDNRKAATIYYEMAKDIPQEEEMHLFRAAVLLRDIDKDKAREVFDYLCSLDGEKISDATFNAMILYFDAFLYEEIIAKKDQWLQKLPEEKSLSYYYVVASSYFALKDYENAMRACKKYINLSQSVGVELKNILLYLTECSLQLEDVKQLEFATSHFEVYFPNDEELYKILFARAISFRNHKNFDLAEKDFEKLETSYLKFLDKEAFFYEYAVFCYDREDYLSSQRRFDEWLNNYASSSLREHAWRYYVNASVEVEKLFPEEEQKEYLISVLTRFLHEKDLATEEEIRDFSFLIAQTEFELKNYDAAINDMISWVEKYPNHPRVSACYLNIALCYKDYFSDSDSFCFYAQRALDSNEGILDKKAVHLQLFNAYYSQKEDGLSLAADHLYEAFKIEKESILFENKLWLSDYFYKKALSLYREKNIDEYSVVKAQAKEVLESIVYNEDTQPNTLSYLEPKIIHLANLLSMDSHNEQKKNLLHKLFTFYEENRAQNWNHQNETYFQLAKTYEKEGQKEQALQFYEKISSLPKEAYFSAAAQLHSIRLRVDKICEKDFSLDNPDLVNELSLLKDLKIKKYFDNEPMHLEAALDYVEIRSLLEKEKDPIEKQLMLLENVQKEFLSQENIFSKDYHYQKEQGYEKEELFSAYMKFIDAKMILCRAKMQQDPQLQVQLFKEAKNLLLDIQNLETFNSEYIGARVSKTLESMTGNSEG